MSSKTRLAALCAAVLAVVAALAVSACGGSDNKSGGGSSTSGDQGSSGAGKKGGTISVVYTAFPDYLDPALSYTANGWEALHLAYPGLVTFPAKPGQAGAEVVPGLAKDLPKISSDGLTYTFQLRDGLQFSDGTPLKASDFKASIERILKQDSQGSGLGYTNIVGGADYLKTKKGGVKGITVDDATGKIEIKLVKPRGSFLYELAIPFAGVVPKDTPAKNLTKSPPPGAGRYMFKDVQINRGFTMVKNPNFSKSLEGTAVDTGNADEFDAQVDSETSSQVTKVVQNDIDYMVDNPPPDRTGELKAKYSNRFDQFPTNSSFYFFMNTEAPPFDKLQVRQAVNYAIDPAAINRIQGGVIAPANTILPPGVPGYQKWPNLYPHNLAKAKQLIQQAGASGANVTVWGESQPESKATIEYYANVLNQIGLKAKAKIIAQSTYFTTIGDRKTKVQTGWLDWFQDYPHPADFIDVLLNPDKVVATGNNNISYNANDKELAAKINKAAAQPVLTPAVKKQWADIDREVQQKAYWAIYGNRKQSTFFSDKLDHENCKGEHSVYTHDWSEFCLK